MADKGRDFYKILGVEKNADENAIRKAYKKGAVKWHPDRNPDNKEEAAKKVKNENKKRIHLFFFIGVTHLL